MSALAVHAPLLLPSPRDIIWDNRPELAWPPRPDPAQLERIELPSIRQAIPEIHRSRPEPDYRPYSPTALAPLNDDLSPSSRKRRRLSADDDVEEARERAVPRIHRSPRTYPSTTGSPMSGSRRASVLSMAESWTSSTRTSPHAPPRGPPAPSTFDAASITRSEWRPQLPSLPALTFDRAPRAPSSWDERGFDAATLPTPPTEPPPAHTLPAPYAYSQPRGLSYSGPSTSPGSPHYRAPFSNIHPAGFTGFPYLADAADGEGKQRRRRGNLPKETTDKLRAWFLTHLGHPYPAEDEKQELMRQTGLQMNQISNWFINARRRQLPALTKTARGSEAKAEGVRKEIADGEKAPSGESEGEGSSYDDCEGLGRRCGPGMVKRESI